MTQGLRTHCYYRDGRPMEDIGDLTPLKMNPRYLQVARTWLDRKTAVSTVWIGFDMSCGDGPPLIFETALICNCPEPGDIHGDFGPFLKAPDERRARTAHKAMCAFGRVMLGHYSETARAHQTRRKQARMRRQLRSVVRFVRFLSAQNT